MDITKLTMAKIATYKKEMEEKLQNYLAEVETLSLKFGLGALSLCVRCYTSV